MELKNLKIHEARKLLDSGKISAPELASLYLERISATDDKLSAYITVTAETAMENAAAAQKLIDEKKAASLTGIPLAIKDNVCTDGILTTCSSKMLDDFIPPYDAAVIEKLKEAGYVLLGKTSLDEFAMGNDNQTAYAKKTKNPYDVTRVPGGSSGGSASAVSAGLAMAALGTDTGGSIRQPSAFCGVTGIKPTYGRVSRFGVVAFASSLDQVGAIAKDSHDCALILNTISGADSRDATSARLAVPDFAANIGKSIKGMRVALPKEFFSDAIDDEVKTAVLGAAKQLQSYGAELVECSIPGLKYAVSAYYLISSAEAASNLARFDGIRYGLKGEGATYEEILVDSRNRGFGDEVKRRILLGNYALSSGYYDDYYVKALALKQQIVSQYQSVFEQADIVLTPTAPTVAPVIGNYSDNPAQAYLSDICTVTVNIAGLPALSTPCGYGKNGMPIGMSLVGRKFDEQTLIQAASAFESDFKPIYPQI